MPNRVFGCVFAELCHFLSVLKGLEDCEPLFAYLETLFYDFQTWEKVLKGSEGFGTGLGTLSLVLRCGVLCFGFGSRDQVSC